MIDLKDKTWLEWLEEKDPFSAGYLSCDSEHHTIRLACALRNYWSSMPSIIKPDDRIVGRMSPGGVGGFSFGSGIYCSNKLADELKQQFPEWKEYIDLLVTFWLELIPASRISFPEDERFMNGQNVYWAGWGGHAVLGFDQVLAEGTDGIRKTINHYQAKELDPEKRL
jgi:hypothetical protein